MAPACCTLTLPYPPSVNRWTRVVGGRPILSAEARQYKQDAGVLALAAGVIPWPGPIAVSITVYRPRKRGDLDGIFKLLIDALNGIAWVDDSQIVELHAFRRDDKHLPRAVVTVAAAGP